MSDTTPERTMPELPDEIEQALGHALNTWYGYGKVNGNLNRKPAHDAMMSLRQAILAALEPERELPDRTEHISNLVNGSFLAAYGQGLIDIADQAIEEWQSDLTEDLVALFADDLASALEPERVLRDAAVAVADAARDYMYCSTNWDAEGDRLLGILRDAVDAYDDLATSSANVRRE